MGVVSTSAAEVGVHEARILHAEKMHLNALEQQKTGLKDAKSSNWIKNAVKTTGAGMQGKKRTGVDVLKDEADGRGIDTTSEHDPLAPGFICFRDLPLPHTAVLFFVDRSDEEEAPEEGYR